MLWLLTVDIGWHYVAREFPWNYQVNYQELEETPVTKSESSFHNLIHPPNQQVRARLMLQHTWMCCQVCLTEWTWTWKRERKKKKKKVQSFVSTSLNKCARWFRWKGDNTQHVWQAVFVRVFFLYLTARWRDYTVISSVHTLTLHHRFSSECLHSSHSLIRPRVVKKRKKKEKENCPPAKPLPTVHVMPSSALFKKKKNWLYALEPQVQGLKANISKIFPQQSLRRLH